MNESHERAEARKWTTSLGDPQSELKWALKWPKSRASRGTLKMLKAEAHSGKGGCWHPNAYEVMLFLH